MKKNLYINPETQVTEMTGMQFICDFSNPSVGEGEGGTSGIDGGGPIIGS